MDNQEQFEKVLKQAYKKCKEPVNTSQLNKYKQACAKNEKYISWQRVQWLLACSGVVFLCIQLFIATPSDKHTTITMKSATQYDNIEIHRVQQGEYQREIVTQKQRLDLQLKHSQMIRKATISHGEVIEQHVDRWLIADCQKRTLISLEQSLLAQLVPNWKTQPSFVGRYLALNQNSAGHIIGLSGIERGQQIYSCP
ncbi:hypothetical protein [Pseudoalteromonas sp. MMG012]|uniref:hypothetical protein n=1 Tax=Pseudoalteromonas sp. MMG012 TaxID=2822686 RepID=UPI001B3A6D00|nr:hypothetical protein [Pseudoalteromonas sp. MMG012]MBQ4852351.1 hypothetical protein [Pseudoalteromonas sp. MMG012]